MCSMCLSGSSGGPALNARLTGSSVETLSLVMIHKLSRHAEQTQDANAGHSLVLDASLSLQQLDSLPVESHQDDVAGSLCDFILARTPTAAAS